MKQVVYIFCFFTLAGLMGAGADEESDRLRELEEVVIATNEVNRNADSETLKAFVTTSREDAARSDRKNFEAAKGQQPLTLSQTDSKDAVKKAARIRDEGGAEAQQIQQDTTHRIIQKEQDAGASEAFKDSLQYWTEEGVYNAGFEGGRAAGEKAFGESERNKRGLAPHHGRRDREGGSE